MQQWAEEHAGAIATAAIIAGIAVSAATLVVTGPVGLIVDGGLLSGGLSILANRGAVSVFVEGPSIFRPGTLGAGPQVAVGEVGLAGVSFSLSSMEVSDEGK